MSVRGLETFRLDDCEHAGAIDIRVHRRRAARLAFHKRHKTLTAAEALLVAWNHIIAQYPKQP